METPRSSETLEHIILQGVKLGDHHLSCKLADTRFLYEIQEAASTLCSVHMYRT
jgi:hypothetical protein